MTITSTLRLLLRSPHASLCCPTSPIPLGIQTRGNDAKHYLDINATSHIAGRAPRGLEAGRSDWPVAGWASDSCLCIQLLSPARHLQIPHKMCPDFCTQVATKRGPHLIPESERFLCVHGTLHLLQEVRHSPSPKKHSHSPVQQHDRATALAYSRYYSAGDDL